MRDSYETLCNVIAYDGIVDTVHTLANIFDEAEQPLDPHTDTIVAILREAAEKIGNL